MLLKAANFKKELRFYKLRSFVLSLLLLWNGFALVWHHCVRRFRGLQNRLIPDILVHDIFVLVMSK